MKSHSLTAALLVATLFAANGAALAEKPDWTGGGKAKHGKHEERNDSRRERGDALRFNDDSRRIIFDYYGTQARAGHCPPGLAKRNNGCQPPGQAKKWRIGQALPGDLRYHDLPRDILMRLPPPPSQHRYVQVAGDILMIAVGTSMVVDAVEDILR